IVTRGVSKHDAQRDIRNSIENACFGLALTRAGAGPRPRAITFAHQCRNIQQGADMTQRIHENLSAAGRRLVAIMGKTMPPRNPADDDDDDDDEDEKNDTEPDDERQPPIAENPTKTRAASANESGH